MRPAALEKGDVLLLRAISRQSFRVAGIGPPGTTISGEFEYRVRQLGSEDFPRLGDNYQLGLPEGAQETSLLFPAQP